LFLLLQLFYFIVVSFFMGHQIRLLYLLKTGAILKPVNLRSAYYCYIFIANCNNKILNAVVPLYRSSFLHGLANVISSQWLMQSRQSLMRSSNCIERSRVRLTENVNRKNRKKHSLNIKCAAVLVPFPTLLHCFAFKLITHFYSIFQFTLAN